MKTIISSVVALFSIVLFSVPASLEAQMISTGVSSTTSMEVEDLTALGTTDWVQFGVSGSNDGFSYSNEKSGGSVEGLDTVGAVSGTGSGTTPPFSTEYTQTVTVSYTNGTSPGSSATTVNSQPAGHYAIHDNPNGIPIGQIGNNDSLEDGSTLSFTIDFNQAISSGTIYLVANSFEVHTATLTAALSNGNTTTTTTGYDSGNQNDVFTIDLSDITAGSSLNLSYEMVAGSTTQSQGMYANVSLEGVALDLTEAPEPSTYALMLGGLAFLGFRVRRKLAWSS